ncbi:MAG: hypothetical protein ACREGB_03750 [Candidatus Saccharimonadales bacterium]
MMKRSILSSPPNMVDLTLSTRENVGYYTIANLDVAQGFRQLGLGKRLVGIAFEHAQRLKAQVLVSAITSRECLDVMESVFGSEHLSIYELGEYAPAGQDVAPDSPTSAALWYELD